MAAYNLGKIAMTPRGEYSTLTGYEPLDVVTHLGGCFLCRSTCSRVEPGADSGWENYWQLICNGIASVTCGPDGQGGMVMKIIRTDGTVGRFPLGT